MAKIIGLIDVMENNDNKFKPGDFVSFSNKPGSFAIYEGIDLSVTTYKKISVLLYYDPSKYTPSESGGYVMKPFLEMSTKNSMCEKTLDSDEPSYWIRRCNQFEIEDALKVLHENNIIWDEENLSLLNAETGEVLTKIHVPKAEYNGQIIKPMSLKFKKLLKVFCRNKNPKTSSYSYNNYWNRYSECGYEDYWD